jgi:hypothetical protein
MQNEDAILNFNLAIQSFLDDYNFVISEMSRSLGIRLSVALNQIWRWSLAGSPRDTKKQYLTQVIDALAEFCYLCYHQTKINVNKRFASLLDYCARASCDVNFIPDWCLRKFFLENQYSVAFYYLEKYASVHDVDLSLQGWTLEKNGRNKMIWCEVYEFAPDSRTQENFRLSIFVWKLKLQLYKSINRFMYLELGYTKELIEAHPLQLVHLYHILFVIEWNEFYDYLYHKCDDSFRKQITDTLAQTQTKEGHQFAFLKSVLVPSIFSEKALVRMISEYVLFLPDSPLILRPVSASLP